MRKEVSGRRNRERNRGHKSSQGLQRRIQASEGDSRPYLAQAVLVRYKLGRAGPAGR